LAHCLTNTVCHGKEALAREIVMADKITTTRIHSEQLKRSWLAASPLGVLAGFEAKGITDLSVAELGKRYGFPIDPQLLYVRKLCRLMIRKDVVST
jgi:hypothetical protein